MCRGPSALPADPPTPCGVAAGALRVLFCCCPGAYMRLSSYLCHAALMMCECAGWVGGVCPSALPAEPPPPCGVTAGASRGLCCCCRGAYMRLSSYLYHAALLMGVCGVGGRRVPWPIGPPCRTLFPVWRRRGCFSCALLWLSWCLYAALQLSMPYSAADVCVRCGWEACAVGALRVLCCCCPGAYMRLSSYLCHAVLLMCVCGVGGRCVPRPIGPPCRTLSPVWRRRGCSCVCFVVVCGCAILRLCLSMPCSAADMFVCSGVACRHAPWKRPCFT